MTPANNIIGVTNCLVVITVADTPTPIKDNFYYLQFLGDINFVPKNVLTALEETGRILGGAKATSKL